MSSGSQFGRTASASGCARLESAIPGGTDDWEGLNDHQLYELFKDPKQNGNRSVGQIVEHMSTPLVLWGGIQAMAALLFRCQRPSSWQR